jgi:polysaccharide export outer membrane protein
LLAISVFGEPELSRDVRVAMDGTANIVMIGNTKLAGMTAQQAGDAIAEQFRAHNLLLRPHVNVLIKDPAPRTISVLGEVQHPGMYPVSGVATLLRVLSMAGGLTSAADPKVTVRHSDGQIDSTLLPIQGSDTAIDTGEDPQVSAGDIVMVRRAGVVYILGEVNRPGGFVMQNGGHITILELLSQAGGANNIAALDNSVLLRKTSTGYSDTKVKLRQIVVGKHPDMDLLANDVIYVPNNKLKSAARGTRDIATAVETASIYAVLR